MQLLAMRLQGGGDITAEDVQRAFTRSGTLLEAKLGAATGGASRLRAPRRRHRAGPGAEHARHAVVRRVKMALIVLRRVLKNWTDGSLTADAEHRSRVPARCRRRRRPSAAAPANRLGPPPPYRSGPTMGQQAANPASAPMRRRELIGEHLHGRDRCRHCTAPP